MSATEPLGDEMLSDFLDESSQLLDLLNRDLMQLEQRMNDGAEQEAAVDIDLINTMFRNAHSIKGLSAMFGLMNINKLTHHVENAFDAVRKNELPLTDDVMQAVFQGIDRLGELLEILKNEGNDEADVAPACGKLHEVLAAKGCDRKQTTQADAEKALAALTADVKRAAPAAPTKPKAESCDFRLLFNELRDESDIPANYIAILIDETEQSLDSISESLLRADVSENRDLAETLLIIFHRIKGSAASVGLNRLTKLAHLLEDMFQAFRECGTPMSPEIVDIVLRCCDGMRGFVASLRAGSPDTSRFADLAGDLEKVRLAVPKDSQEPDWVCDLRKAFSITEPLVAISILFEQPGAFVGLKASLVAQKLHAAGDVLYCDPPCDTLEARDDLQTITVLLRTVEKASLLRSKLHLTGVSSVNIQAVAPRTDSSIPPLVLPDHAGSKSIHETSSTHEAAVESTPTANVKVRKEAAPAADKQSEKPNETLRVDIVRLDELMNLAGQLVINKARFNEIGESFRDSLPSKSAAQNFAGAVTTAKRLCEAITPNHSNEPLDLDAVRAQLRRLTSDLESAQREFDRIAKIRCRIGELGDATHQLERVCDGIQKTVMDTRMVPIGPLFQRFKRVIRDITRTNGREIQLVLRGEKTELDKRMIDELGDPLIHMIRNSADHGIEPPEEREAKGKPRLGTITLDAFHRGNSIVIQVVDDGRGLDRDRIVAKAIEKKIITSADAERLTPQQVYALIWAPGFSTAEKVTEISGRGMGMDIVQAKIAGINGTVEVDSVLGKGCTFTIRLPLTLAILPSLSAEIEGDVFALPIETVSEIVTAKSAHLTTVHGQPTAVIRGRAISVIDLNDIFSWNRPAKTAASAAEDRPLVVLQHEGRELGMFVDRLLGEDDVVIKSLAENFRNIGGIAGASILGDGRVSLILDTAALMQMAAGASANRNADSKTNAGTSLTSAE